MQRRMLIVAATAAVDGRDGQIHQRIGLHQSDGGGGSGSCSGGSWAAIVLTMVLSIRHVQLPLFGVAHHRLLALVTTIPLREDQNGPRSG